MSYASEDRPQAQMLAQTLEGQGWSTFWDRTIPAGKTWREVIGRELDEARCVIVLWSNISIVSGWVQEEADDGRRRGILIPVLIENVLPPIGFRSIQAADLSDWDGADSIPAFRRLTADIAGLIGPAPKEVEEERRLAEAEVAQEDEEEHRRAEAEAARKEEERKEAEREIKREAKKKRRRTEAKAEYEAEKERKQPEAETKGKPGKLKVYLALAALGAITGFIMAVHNSFYPSSKVNPFRDSFAPSLFALGLVTGLVLANRQPRRGLAIKVIMTAGVVVPVDFVLALLEDSRVVQFQELPEFLFVWTGISLAVVIAVALLEIHGKDTPSNRLLWGVACGVAAGALLGALDAWSSDFNRTSINEWLVLSGDGLVLGALVGSVEAIMMKFEMALPRAG